MIAEYKNLLPDKQVLQAKLHEFYEQAREHAKLAPLENTATAAGTPKNHGKRAAK